MFRTIFFSLGIFICFLACAGKSFAQETGSIEGIVKAQEDQSPLAGVTIILEGTPNGTTSNQEGKFTLSNIEPGNYSLTARRIDRESFHTKISVKGGETIALNIELNEQSLLMPDVTVSATRERESKREVPATIGIISTSALQEVKPAHPSEVMKLIPGVWVNVTGGEGHMTAIRQPLTTNPVYLYLEDGVPTRSTGFFNHNALYEINIPQASGIEVMKGPGNALYGSDAIGGIVNVLTNPAPYSSEFQTTLEGGSFGWNRALLSGGTMIGEHRLRADLNLTKTNGWRTSTDYHRESGTVRWDANPGKGATLKTIVTYSNIDQSTAGSSAISRADYESDPTKNYTPISFRKVGAFRVSSSYEQETGASLISVTPYFRINSMDIMPNWSLSYDPGIWYTKNNSYGLMAKYRYDFEPMRTRVIVGVDVDYSPGTHIENKIAATKTAGIYTTYTEGAHLYDYAVTFREIAPYLHAEVSPVEQLRITAGMRLDNDGYNYTNNLSSLATGNWKRPDNAEVSYSHLSPKLGATYTVSDAVNMFVSYYHGFRVPSESQLFRQGSAVNTVDLKPVKVNSYETGFRGMVADLFHYELSLYTMSKEDDILSFSNPVSGLTEAVNAGKTTHEGIEVALGTSIMSKLRIDLAFSYAKHTYDEWVVSGVGAGITYSGKEMETAPKKIGNLRFAYDAGFGTAGLEITHLGSYKMDPANTHTYAGHTLVNFSLQGNVPGNVQLYGRVTNLLDKRFAESASYTTTRGEEFAPGLPRALVAGVSYNLH